MTRLYARAGDVSSPPGAGSSILDRLHGAPQPRNALMAGAAGAVLGSLALAPQLRPKTTTELALGAVVIALISVIAANPRRVLLCILVFDIPLEWGKTLAWNADLANVGALAGIDVSMTTIALAGLYVMWGLDRRARGQRAARPLIRPALPLLVYSAFNVASVAVASNRVLSEYELILLTQMLLLFVYVVSTTRSRKDIEFLATATLAGLVAEALIVLLTSVTGYSPNFLGLKARVDPSLYSGRLGGTVGSPNDAAAYFTLTLSLALGVLVSPKTTMRLKRLAQIATPLGVLALLTTQSRGGWLAFITSALIVTTWAARHHLVRARTIALTAFAIAALIVPFEGQVMQRLGGGDNGSAHSRIALVTLASKMISAHPVLGLGINNVGINIPNYAGPQFAGQWLYTVHDKYLLVWAEAGVGALIAFLWFLVATLRRGWRCAVSRDPYVSPLALGLTAGIAGQLVHMAFDIFQSKPEVEGLWFAAALVAAMEVVVRRERPAKPRGDHQLGHAATVVREPVQVR